MKKAVRLMFALALAAVALVYGAVTAVAYGTQDKLVFPQTVNKVEARQVVAVPLPLKMADGTTLHGGLVASPAGNAHPQTLVILFGGNAHDVVGFTNFWGTSVIQTSESVVVAGLSYRGYPNFLTQPSEGAPTEQNVEADALEIATQLRATYQPSRTVIVGYSLGTAVASRLAYQLQQNGQPAAALILAAPFTSMVDLAKTRHPYLPVKTLLKYPFDTASFFSNLNLPVTVMYTETDGTIPTAEPKALATSNTHATLVKLSDTTHGDVLNVPEMPALLHHAAGLHP